ncbi:MAG: D-amino-acid transaminase [Alphaproteobacteria bacterium]|nr:D-amino-acid transaminase [Alphaproteobacteria bacterium]
MSRCAYVNGRFLPLGEARVAVEDRGYQLADGVYEVVLAVGGRLIDWRPHAERLDRSLGALRIAWPVAPPVLDLLVQETLRHNLVRDGIVYLQVTRGVARREHAFPADAPPALVIMARPQGLPAARQRETGIAVLTQPDQRWRRPDIKSIALLANVLAKQAAREAGCYESWFVNPAGTVLEGASTNAWIVAGNGALVTHPADRRILNGVTRLRVLRLARAAGLAVEERPFSLAEAKAAREAFLTSTTAGVLPIVRIDQASVGNGAPGALASELGRLYERYVEQSGDQPL